MATLICGSIAYDSIMTFEGRFREHILPDQVHLINLSFLVPTMRREFGGCAGNIAYALHLLGGDARIMGTMGALDAQPYLDRLDQFGLRRDHVRVLPDTYTAQAMITTDLDNNQITAFHPGAMMQSHLNHAGDAPGIKLAIVGPDGFDGMVQHVEELAKAGVPFVFDPGQGLPLFDGATLRRSIELATYVAVNDYEAKLVSDKTGWSEDEIASRVDALVITAWRARRDHPPQAGHGANSCRAGRADRRSDRLWRCLPGWPAVRHRAWPRLGNHGPPREPDGLDQDRPPGAPDLRTDARRDRRALRGCIRLQSQMNIVGEQRC